MATTTTYPLTSEITSEGRERIDAVVALRRAVPGLRLIEALKLVKAGDAIVAAREGGS